ncbi:ISPsy1 transposase (plasmid) [Streptomyces sp. FR-008]|nr:ISPsy1 transposase [Streptomyces sp. FR-008]
MRLHQIDKVRDVVGLYLDPPEKALVLCVDEKSQIQAWTGPSRSCRSRTPQPRLHPCQHHNSLHRP